MSKLNIFKTPKITITYNYKIFVHQKNIQIYYWVPNIIKFVQLNINAYSIYY